MGNRRPLTPPRFNVGSFVTVERCARGKNKRAFLRRRPSGRHLNIDLRGCGGAYVWCQRAQPMLVYLSRTGIAVRGSMVQPLGVALPRWALRGRHREPTYEPEKPRPGWARPADRPAGRPANRPACWHTSSNRFATSAQQDAIVGGARQPLASTCSYASHLAHRCARGSVPSSSI